MSTDTTRMSLRECLKTSKNYKRFDFNTKTPGVIICKYDISENIAVVSTRIGDSSIIVYCILYSSGYPLMDAGYTVYFDTFTEAEKFAERAVDIMRFGEL